MFTLLAHGAFVTMIDKTAYDGWLDSVAYDRIGELLGEARANRAHFGHQPVREVGIYFSTRRRDWIGRDKPAPWFQSAQVDGLQPGGAVFSLNVPFWPGTLKPRRKSRLL